MDSAGVHTCIYCGERFKTDELCWYIQRDSVKDTLINKRYENETDRTDEGEVGGHSIVYQARNLDATPFWTVMNSFEVDDDTGKNFYHMMSGVDLTEDMLVKRPAIIYPKNFDFYRLPDETPTYPPDYPNIYETPDGEHIRVFRLLTEEEEHYPGVRFTDDFVNIMEKQGVTTLAPNRSFIERCCIRPLCPMCSSFLPAELINDPEHNDVVKLAFIGPVGSGKTSFNLVNVIFDRFTRGEWTADRAGRLAPTHYLSDKTYYTERLQQKRFGDRTTPKAYLPPLLLRLRYGSSRNVLLVLMDVAGEYLENYSKNLETEQITRRDYYYRRLFEEVDGYLLMLDGEQEVQDFASLRRAPGNQRESLPLKTLLTFHDSVFSDPAARRALKPAALVITKCDTLFQSDRALNKTLFDGLFANLTPLEKALWQTNETPEAACGAWQADRHEALQLGLKECLRTWSPSLWNILRKNFSRVDIFPESSVGHALVEAKNLNEKNIQTLGLEPFYTADPVFWLLDIVGQRRERDATNERTKR